MSLHIVFMGTPDFAVPALSEILGAGHQVVAVYSQPPRPAGRGMEARVSPVQGFAEKVGIPVMTPVSLKTSDARDAFDALGADAAVVAAYGLILPKPILDAPEHGCLNLHASLLPRWRGAAPIHRAVMAGDEESGVMVMRMEEGLDTGPICLAERVPIGANQTSGGLHDELARLGADLMVRALAALERGSLDCVAQPDAGVTYAGKIEKTEARIDWSRPANEVHNKIRGLSPWPGAWFEMQAGGKDERVKALASTLQLGSGAPGELLDEHLTVACGEGAVRLLRVQRAGKKPMEASEFLRGNSLEKSTVLA
jgi:methionyl-tRNA formyltransferase